MIWNPEEAENTKLEGLSLFYIRNVKMLDRFILL